MDRQRFLLKVAAVLLVLLALARGAGGVVLMLSGKAALPEAHAAEPAMRAMGFGLVCVALLGVVAAWCVWRRAANAVGVTVAALAAFVAGGLVNGFLLFGRPTDPGTIANLCAATAILAFLLLGRPALKGGAR